MSLTYANGAPREGAARQGIAFRQNEPAELNSQTKAKQVIPAELTGSDICTSAGITTTGVTPVLSLCRELLAAGLDADTAVEVFRGATMALRIRAIGEAAGLEINAEGNGFRPARKPDTAPLVRQNGRRRALTTSGNVTTVAQLPADHWLAFRERCWAKAYLFAVGEYEFQPAVDELQHFADRLGLIAQYGQDRVQAEIAAHFDRVRR
jgi:hypothetical protein